MTRFVSIHLPFWPTDRLGWPANRRAALLVRRGAALSLAAVTPAGLDSGLRPGQGLADALAAFPDLPTEPLDSAGTLADLERLALRCRRWSPLTAPDLAGEAADGFAPGTAPDAALLVDITGAAGLFGGEEGVLADIASVFSAFGLHHRLGLADTPGAAWAWAVFGGGGILPAGAIRQMLAPLPIAALRLPGEIAAGLHRLGLRQIGALLDQPRAPLATRFGPGLLRRLDAVLGRVPQPVAWRKPAARFIERTPFVEPIGTRDSVDAALAHLLNRLLARLSLAGLGVRRLSFTLLRVDGTQQEFTIGTAQAERDPTRLLRLFRDPLDGLNPGFGIEAAWLDAQKTGPIRTRQSGLAVQGDSRGEPAPEDSAEQLAPLLDRLRQSLGDQAVYRLLPRASHWPERAVMRADPMGPQGKAAAGDDPSPAPNLAPRPIQLYHPPQPIEGDGTGSFVWRGQRHVIRHAIGPERIAGEWWHKGAAPCPTRDYWRVEDMAGRRFWVFQVRTPASPPASGPAGQAVQRWFLHGIFP